MQHLAVGRQNRKRPAQMLLATSLQSPAREMCVCFNRQIWGEDWGWLHEHSLKGLECGLSCKQGRTQVHHGSPIVNTSMKGEVGSCNSSLILKVLTVGPTLPLQAQVAHMQRRGRNLSQSPGTMGFWKQG